MILYAIVECPDCFEEFEGQWPVPDAEEIQDVEEAPVHEMACTGCGCVFEEQYPGWVVHTEAG